MSGVVLFGAVRESHHRQVCVWEAEPLRGAVKELKFLLECRCDVSGVCWNMGWRGSSCCLTRSNRLATVLPMPGGATPARICR